MSLSSYGRMVSLQRDVAMIWARRAVVAVSVGMGSACGGEETATSSRESLLDPTTCAACHPKHYEEWSGSMHAYASKDPLFRAVNARGQEETSGELAEFCVNCHAPMAVREGATQDGLNLESVPQALQGVTCYFCHNVVSVEGTHNNPLKLANDVTMRGGIADPESNQAHASAYTAFLDADESEGSSQLCGACHDVVIPKHLAGAADDVRLERTYGEWTSSLFNDPQSQPLSCSQCHMRIESAVHVADAPHLKRRSRHLHDFPAVDVALVDFPQRTTQLAEVQRLLDTALRTEICVSVFGDLRVVLESLSPGHNFPSGASQHRRLWVEVRGYDQQGEPLFTHGVPPEGTPLADAADAWILRDRTFKANGEPAHMFWDVARVEQGTIPAPVTRDPGKPGFHRELSRRLFRVPSAYAAARITLQVRMQPVGPDVVDDLIQSGHLEPALREMIPIFDLLPNRKTSTHPATVVWTQQAVETDGYLDGEYLCVESAPQAL
jgi:hypothetical protein